MDKKYLGFASDLDRTVLRRSGFTEKTFSTIQNMVDKGVIFIPASGRSIKSFPSELLNMRGIKYAVSSNGASIYDLEEKKFVRKFTLRPDVCERIIELVTENEIFFECFIDGQAYTSKDYYDNPNSFADKDDVTAYIKASRLPVADIKAFMIENKDNLDSISIVGPLSCKGRIIERLKQNIDGIYITVGAPRLIEISDIKSGKHNGIREAAALLKIPMEKLVAFGDGDNDSELLRESGLGIAVGNATEMCKNAADYVIGDYLEDSVADELVKIFG